MHALVEKVKLLEKAWNAGDREAVLSLYADDIVLCYNAEVQAEDKKGIARLLEMDVAAHTEVKFVDVRVVEKDAVACTMVETNDFYRLIGLPEFRKIDTIRFRDGLICEESEACDVHEWQAMRRAMRALYDTVFEWAAVAYPETLAAIRPEGQLLRTGEAYAQLVALCDEWKRTMQPDY